MYWRIHLWCPLPLPRISINTTSCFGYLCIFQEAFDATMGDFVSRSRERQRYVLLRGEERRIQELEALERQRLFGIGDKRFQITLTDPMAGTLLKRSLYLVFSYEYLYQRFERTLISPKNLRSSFIDNFR